MKTKIFFSALLFTLFSLSSFAADNVKEATFKISGNCGMCKSRIEKSLKISEVKFAKWDKTTKMVTVAYIANKISLDSLQHRVASVGHDTEKFKASDAAYNSLPECCLYRK